MTSTTFEFSKMTSGLYAKIVIDNDSLLWSAQLDWDKFKKKIDDYFELISGEADNE